MSVARDRSAQRPRGGGGRLLRPEPYESNLPANTWAFTIRRERRPARLSARLWSFGRASPSGSQAVCVGPQITRNRVAQKGWGTRPSTGQKHRNHRHADVQSAEFSI